MIRRLFLLLVCCLPCVVFAASSFKAGDDYIILNEKVDAAAHKPQVLEFFSYGCPWCARLEAPLTTWRAQHRTGLVFKRVPVVFHKEWVYYAKAYYAAHLLGLSKTFDPLLFDAIQNNKPKLENDKALEAFFAAHGVDLKTAVSAFEQSTEIALLLKKGTNKMARYQVASVPAFVVNGRYKTDLSMAKSPERLFAILDYLVTRP